MLQFVHITDTHIVPAGETLYGLDPLARLKAAVAAINDRHVAPGPGQAAFVLHTGDLTHWGQPEAYAALRDALAGLRLPVHLLIGNHDGREAFRAAFPAAPVDPAGFVQSVLDRPEARLIMLDTHVSGSAVGTLCVRRRGWLADRLAETEAPVLLALHHPPMRTGLQRMDSIALDNPEALWEVVAPHRHRVRHMLFGHLHRPVSGSWRGIGFSTLRGTCHQVAFDLDSPAECPVPGSREPPAYGLVRLDGQDVVVHAHDYMDSTADFVL